MTPVPSSGEESSTKPAGSIFSCFSEAPPDPILGLNQAFAKDPNHKKQNLGPGVYMDGQGKVCTLKSIRQAELRLASKERTEGYLPIDGNPQFNRHIQEILLGKDSASVKNGLVVTAQAIGGTGAVSLGAHLLKRFYPDLLALISNPTWPNHRGIFSEVGFKVVEYPYYDPATKGVHFDALMNTLKSLPRQAVVVLHANCHNPTGADLSNDQWTTLADFFASSSHIPMLDFAYQGFKTGLEEDAYPARLFAQRGIAYLIATSFSKSFSLYSMRVGGLTVLTGSAQETQRVSSHLKSCIRTIWSNPPAWGAVLVNEVLDDPSLRVLWEQELGEMRDRIKQMRSKFVEGMNARGFDMSHVLRQYGMFSYTGLTAAQAEALKQKYSIYIVNTGRISVPALNMGNMEYVCDAVADVLKSA